MQLLGNSLSPTLLLFSLVVLAPGSRHTGFLQSNYGLESPNVTLSELPPAVGRQHGPEFAQLGVVCGETVQVTSQSSRKTTCPKDCPVYSKNKADDEHCTFTCVPATVEDCKAHNPNAPVIDLEMGICRACMVEGCSQCMNDGSDKCKKCSRGFRLRNGKCFNETAWVWYILGGAVGLFGCLVVAWVVDLARRPITNEKGLAQGLALRSRAKLHMPAEKEAGQRLWPLTTNLCTTPVAGPGTLLQFNFQVALIVWALVLAAGWYALGVLVDGDLFVLGTKRAHTPRQNCVIVAWGYETQHALMWTKVLFCGGAYIFSFVGALLLAVRQLWIFDDQDEENTTHKDFCAELHGLPPISGKELVEKDLTECLEAATGQKIIGISVCWDMLDKEEDLMRVIEDMVDERECAQDENMSREVTPTMTGENLSREVTPTMTGMDTTMSDMDGTMTAKVLAASGAPELSGMAKVFSRMEKGFLSPTTQKIITKGRRKAFPKRHYQHIAAGEKAALGIDIEPILRDLTSTSKAFVVFENEVSRDAAVNSVLHGVKPLTFKNEVITLREAHCEPDSVNWRNMWTNDAHGIHKRIALGLGVIFFALFIWVVAFYLPYAYFAMSFNYAYGQEPGAVASLTFSMVVCLGNVLMYLVCAEVSDRIGFHYTDDREVCYLLLYSFACTFNVVLDLVCSYYIAYYMMTGMGMKTYDGTRLSEVDTFTDRFETYAMQRELGTTLMEYSFPATFLIPFLIEPFATVYMPYKIMTYIVRVHPELKGSGAEAYLGSTPMDLSRYADLQLNVMIASLIVFFPGGYNMKMFLGLACSHIYIYLFDHWRVLQSVPSFNFAEKKVDWWAQWLLSIPCGLILSALVFKANCVEWEANSLLSNFGYCDNEWKLISKVIGVFVLHVLVHSLVLFFVIPCFGYDKPLGKNHYSECAQRLPCSWFSMNPVHCLRSQFVYGHSPPCDYRMLGKEHLIRKNEKIGMYFSAEKADAEKFEYSAAEIKDLLETSSRRVSQSWGTLRVARPGDESTTAADGVATTRTT